MIFLDVLRSERELGYPNIWKSNFSASYCATDRQGNFDITPRTLNIATNSKVLSHSIVNDGNSLPEVKDDDDSTVDSGGDGQWTKEEAIALTRRLVDVFIKHRHLLLLLEKLGMDHRGADTDPYVKQHLPLSCSQCSMKTCIEEQLKKDSRTLPKGSTVIDIMEDKRKGKGTVATDAIKAGSAILQEPPLEWALYNGLRGSICEYCGHTINKKNKNTGPSHVVTKSGGCSYYSVCSQYCQRKQETRDGNLRWETRVLPAEAMVGLRLALRMSMGVVSQTQSPWGRQTRREMVNIATQSAVAAILATSRDEEIAYIRDLSCRILHAFCIVRCNSFDTTVVVKQRNQTGDTDDLQHFKTGIAIFRKASFINHSCEPCALICFQGFHLTLIATRNISSREEIFITYGPRAGKEFVLSRRPDLQMRKSFTCLCAACVSEWEALQCILARNGKEGGHVEDTGLMCSAIENGGCCGRLVLYTTGGVMLNNNDACKVLKCTESERHSFSEDFIRNCEEVMTLLKSSMRQQQQYLKKTNETNVDADQIEQVRKAVVWLEKSCSSTSYIHAELLHLLSLHEAEAKRYVEAGRLQISANTILRRIFSLAGDEEVALEYYSAGLTLINAEDYCAAYDQFQKALEVWKYSRLPGDGEVQQLEREILPFCVSQIRRRAG
eukprot:314281_1